MAFIGFGGVVEYQYTVTNPNATPANNVFLDDDVIGPIAGPLTLDPGASETFFVKQTIEEMTTNTVTASGEVSGATCEEAGVHGNRDDRGSDPRSLRLQGREADQRTLDGVGLVLVDVCVVAYDGAAGGTVLSTQDNVMPGDVISVIGHGRLAQRPGVGDLRCG